jgi:2,5-diamino-6-(ribosylamino)-4(3H)-pyrimidinone 5'-phosphate reductase
LSTRLKEKEEQILHVLECLATESAQGTPIVVEGKKDIETLKALNIEGKIISAKTGGKTLLDVLSVIEEFKPREVILLFDFDRRGREWTKRLKHHLEAERIKVNVTFWCELFKLLGKDVKDIESLTAYVETLKSKIGNS